MTKSLSERFPGVHFIDEGRITIGKNVMIQAGSVIGAIPLMTEIKDLKEEILPVEGNIIIEDNVKIGAGATINFGCGPNTQIAVDEDKKPIYGRDTVIKEGAYIWHRSIIGHDVVIGKHTKVGALVVVAGLCNIGEWSYLALNCIINPINNIGDLVMVGSYSLVMDDVPDKVVVHGRPAKYVRPNNWRPDGWKST